MKDYWELTVKINPDCADIVCEIIYSNFNCEGIVTAEEKYKDLELVSSTNDILKAYIVADTIDIDEIKSFFASKRKEIANFNIVKELGSWEVSLNRQEIVDWSKKWKEHWKPSKVSENIVICPTWEEYLPLKNEIVIKLDPGNAFGTGTHATTQLCIKAIEKYMQKNSSIADIGCGSGILAISSVKCGAEFAVAIDNDPTAIETAKINAKINEVDEKILFETKTVEKIEKAEFDFITANILHNVLAEIMFDLKRIMKTGAKLVLSGILQGKEPIVIEAIKCNNLKIIETMKKAEWIAIVVEKEG